MRWLGNFVGEEQVVRKFAFLPIKANGEWRWLEFVFIHQTWHGNSWHNDWFEDEQIPEQRRKSILKKVKHLSKVDLVLSHTCPYQWQPFDLFLSGIDQNSVDNSTEYWLAEVERNLDYRYWLFGHFHDDRLINDKSQMLFKNVIDLEFLKE